MTGNVVITIYFLLQALTSTALRITKVSVPSPIMVGESGLLECDWASEGDNIYSLKWYLGLHEFYRWTPEDQNPVMVFATDKAFVVDKDNSNKGRVKVRNVTLAAAGLLRCEISAEAPEFHTEYKDVNFTVIDPPDRQPELVGGTGHMEIPNEIVNLNCTSPGAKPAPHLSFRINDEPAREEWLRHYPYHEDPSTKLLTRTLGLSFPLLPRFLQRGYVSVKCNAELESVYWESSEIVVAGVMPQEPVVMEGLASPAGLQAEYNLLQSRILCLSLQKVIVLALVGFLH